MVAKQEKVIKLDSFNLGGWLENSIKSKTLIVSFVNLVQR